MTAHRKSCCLDCGEPDWVEVNKTLPTAYTCTTYTADICPSTMDGGNCDFTISTTVAADFEYPDSGKSSCSSSEEETFTGSCETNGDGGSPNCDYASSVWTSADCSATCSTGAYDFSYVCQSYSGSAGYSNKTVSWNAPTKRLVPDVTVRTGFSVSWDSDRTFGGSCNPTTRKIKKATIEVNVSAVILRLYVKVSAVSNQIWKYTIGSCDELDDSTTKINAQSHDTESWSLGISATDGDSRLVADYIPVAETEVSDGSSVQVNFTYPDKIGFQTDMMFEVDPTISSCGTATEYRWTAQSGLIQRTTSGSWDLYRCLSGELGGTWSTTGVGSEINSVTVAIS
tara:strand:+ start:5746 stop:6768 length:1023 start_codon:yes stop_codon:yes gene_type:complete